MTYVLANWKMYPTTRRAMELLTTIQAELGHRRAAGQTTPRVIVCPPFVSLAPLRAVLDHELVALGAQNCHWETEGPYTGEISLPMLEGLVDYVLIGHSERRAAGETDEQLARKVSAVAGAGLTPVLFVGEDEPSDRALEETERRLERGLAEVDVAESHVLIVYEPTWAIGGEEAASARHVLEVVEQLKAHLHDLGARAPEVIYGGTVNRENVDELAGVRALDGVGATRASLDADELMTIVDRLVAAREAARPE